MVGDVHGDLTGLRDILGHAGLIDDRDRWTGSGSLLIQTGDVIDRGLVAVVDEFGEDGR